jgi:hypothetical protein
MLPKFKSWTKTLKYQKQIVSKDSDQIQALDVPPLLSDQITDALR